MKNGRTLTIVMILSEKLKLLDAMNQRNEERIKRFFS